MNEALIFQILFNFLPKAFQQHLEIGIASFANSFQEHLGFSMVLHVIRYFSVEITVSSTFRP